MGKDENISKDTNAPGTLSMANTGSPNSGGSQFFINVVDNRNLDWFSPGSSKHPVFGYITEGYDLVVAISKVKTRNDNPVEPIRMTSISMAGIQILQASFDGAVLTLTTLTGEIACQLEAAP